MNDQFARLTRAEEQVMQYLWKLERGFVKDILAQFPEPKPAYNTVSTIIRILEEKGFVDHHAYGKTYEYFPVITKDHYSSFSAGKLITDYFDGSAKDLVSFFIKDKKMSAKDLDEILRSMQQNKEE